MSKDTPKQQKTASTPVANKGKTDKPKGPVPDYKKVVKKKEDQALIPLMFYAPNICVAANLYSPDPADKKSMLDNQAKLVSHSRQSTWTAAEQAVNGYALAARDTLLRCANLCSAESVKTWRELDDLEARYIGNKVTDGSFPSRQRFWRFVSFVIRKIKTPGVKSNLPEADHMTSSGRAEWLRFALKAIREDAKARVAKGIDPSLMFRLEVVPSELGLDYNANFYLAMEGISRDAVPPMHLDFYQPLANWAR